MKSTKVYYISLFKLGYMMAQNYSHGFGDDMDLISYIELDMPFETPIKMCSI